MRKDSPEREECRLVPGTPATPPAPKLQAWQIREDASPAIQDPGTQYTAIETPKHMRVGCLSPTSSISAVSSEVPELQVDWTTGELKNPSATASSTTALKKINEYIKGAASIDPDVETLLAGVGESDEEEDVDVGEDKVQTDADHLTPADVTDDLPDDLREWLQNEDIQSDRRLQELLPTDQFTFDWSCDHETFTGKREIFIGDHGPTFPIDDNTKPIDIFLKIFDDNFFDLIVTQMNRYATRQIDQHLTSHSRLNFYKNVTKDEMAVFLAMLILQGLVPLPVEKDYWSQNGYLTLAYFRDLMTYNRFILIKRLMHFTDTDITPLQLTKDEQRLRKIQPVLNIFNEKFSTMYLPRQNICIDESLLKWKGRLSFAQKISTKAAKAGIKSFELCESDTGYLWSFSVYAGKTDGQTGQSDETTDGQADHPTDGPTDGQTDRQTDTDTLPTGATSKIVNELAGPLFNKGYTLVMDNFYNSPLLARYLKGKGTDCYGTLRTNREFVPEALKSVNKSEMRQGELIQSFTPDLNVLLWRDTNMVSLISTYHTGVVGGKEKYGRYKYKPQVVLDYNLSMGGVDKKDQLLSSFPIERVRNQVWYKKVFRRLLNCAVVNCYIIYKTHNPHTTHRGFRNQLAEELIKAFKPQTIERSLKVIPNKLMITSTNKMRPILTGNHFIGPGKSKYSVCVWCRKCRTKHICKQCEVSLCFQICFEEYHTVLEPRH